jgi:hypothetical protein
MFGFKHRAHGPTGGQVPPGQQYAPGTDIGPALIPVPAMSFQAFQARGMIHGSPGTVRIPAAAPFPGQDRELTALATEGVIGMPSSAFHYWCPDIWYQADVPVTIAVQTINQSHELPVQATRPQAVMMVRGTNSPGGISPGEGAFAARIGGKWPIGWPRVLANYPETRGLGARDYG